jgi:hypothetical protein
MHNPDLLNCILVYLHSVDLSYPMNVINKQCHTLAPQSRLWRHIDLSFGARTITLPIVHDIIARYSSVVCDLILDGCPVDHTTLELLQSLHPQLLVRLSIRDTALTSIHSDMKSLLDTIRAIPSLKWCSSGQSYDVGITMALRARPGGYTDTGDNNNALDSVYAELAMELAARGGHVDYATSAQCIRCRLTTIVQGCNACGRNVCLSCQHSVAGQSPIRSPLHHHNDGFDDDVLPYTRTLSTNNRHANRKSNSSGSGSNNNNDGLLMTICNGCDRCYCIDCRRFTSCTGGCHSGQRCDQCARQSLCCVCQSMVCNARCIKICHLGNDSNCSSSNNSNSSNNTTGGSNECGRQWCYQCGTKRLFTDPFIGTCCNSCDIHRAMTLVASTSTASSSSNAAASSTNNGY